jgi:hypothetical protein
MATAELPTGLAAAGGASSYSSDGWGFWLKLLLALQLALMIGWVVAARLAGPGLDTDNYVHLFRAPPSLSDGISRFEPLFLLLVTGLRWATRSPEFIFFAIAAIASMIKFSAVARLPDVSLPLFAAAYLATGMPLYEYNQIRVAVALGFIYFAWNHLETAPMRSALYFAIALGFHYSSALLIVPAVLVVIARSPLAMAAGGVSIGLIAVATLFVDVTQLVQSYATGLMLRAAEVEGAEVNPLSFGVLLMIASTGVFAFARFELKPYILLVCLTGLLVFAVLVRLEIPYSYRVLETFAAVLPYGWARAFRGSSVQRLAVGGLVAAAVAYSPFLWSRLG